LISINGSLQKEIVNVVLYAENVEEFLLKNMEQKVTVKSKSLA